MLDLTQNIFDIEVKFRSACGDAHLLLTPIEVLYPEIGWHSGNEIFLTAEAHFFDGIGTTDPRNWSLDAKVPESCFVDSLGAFADGLLALQAGATEPAELNVIDGSAFVRAEQARRPGYVVVEGVLRYRIGAPPSPHDAMADVGAGEISKTARMAVAFIVDQTSLTPAIESVWALMRQLGPAREPDS